MRKSVAVEQLLNDTQRSMEGLEGLMGKANAPGLAALARMAIVMLDDVALQERLLRQEISAMKQEFSKVERLIEGEAIPSAEWLLERAKKAHQADLALQQAAIQYRTFSQVLKLNEDEARR
jgi:hypothetical protein